MEFGSFGSLSMIHFVNVSKIYSTNNNGSETAALDNVDLKIDSKEFVVLVGKSGAGKSTFVKLLIGEERPSRGRILFGNHEVNRLRPSDLPYLRRQIGVIFQDFRLLPKKTAHENIAFAMEVEGRPQKEITEIVPQVLDMVGLADKSGQFPHQLSGGEKQRVAIARAMVNRPAVVIADEPTGNLDPFNTWEIIKLLLKINELGTTVVLATHSKEIVNTLGRRVITLDNGRLIKDDPNGRYILA